MNAFESAFASIPIEGYDCLQWHDMPALVDGHLENTTALILAACELVEPQTAVVVGAGECFEVPLVALASRFATVTLTDISREALQSAIANPGLSTFQAARITSRIVELNGFDASSVHNIFKGVDCIPDAKKAAEIVTERLRHLAPLPFQMQGKANLIIASCVLSQLHLPILQGIVDGFQHFFPGRVEVLKKSAHWRSTAFELSEQLEQNFLHSLRDNVADDGRVYLSATIHRLQYRVMESGQWQSPGLMRVCRLPELDRYITPLFGIEKKAAWWWNIAGPSRAGQTGHGYCVEGAILSPR